MSTQEAVAATTPEPRTRRIDVVRILMDHQIRLQESRLNFENAKCSCYDIEAYEKELRKRLDEQLDALSNEVSAAEVPRVF